MCARTMALILLLLLSLASTGGVGLLTPAIAHAQGSGPGQREESRSDGGSAQRSLPLLVAGSRVRVVLIDGRVAEGIVIASYPDSLDVEEGYDRRVFARQEIEEISVRGRATGWGAGIGAVTGGTGGLILGGLAGAVLSGMEGGTTNAGDVVGPAVVIGVMFGALGAVVGGGIGSAFPRWERVYPRLAGKLEVPPVSRPSGVPSPRVSSRPRPARQKKPPSEAMGSFTLLLGGADTPQPLQLTRGGGFRLGLVPVHRGRLHLGMEIGRFNPGPARMRESLLLPGGGVSGRTSDSVWNFGATGQVDLSRSALRPYLMGGLAFYDWEYGYPGYSIGGGLEYGLTASTAARVEYRLHRAFEQNSSLDQEFNTLLAGVTISW